MHTCKSRKETKVALASIAPYISYAHCMHIALVCTHTTTRGLIIFAKFDVSQFAFCLPMFHVSLDILFRSNKLGDILCMV